MKKYLLLGIMGIVLCVAGCGKSPVPYEKGAFKDYPSTGTAQYRNAFIEQTFENFFPCEPAPMYQETNLRYLSQELQDFGHLGGTLEGHNFLIYNYRYIPYDETISLLELLISRYRKSDDEKDIVLCGSGSYLFLLGNSSEERGNNSSMKLLQQFSSKDQLPKGAAELLEQVPLEDTRHLQGLQYFQLAPHPK